LAKQQKIKRRKSAEMQTFMKKTQVKSMKRKLMQFIGISLVLLSFSAYITAQKTVVPIVDVKVGGLLGGVQNGKYLDAKTTFSMLKGEQSYTLFGITGKTGDLTATIETPDVPCEEFYYAKTGLENQKGIAVGAGMDWNIVPRTPKAINLNDKTYLKIVSDILRSKGLPKAKPQIKQAVKIDLDGDGVDEVLISANSYGENISPRADVNDYSFVLLRKIVAGKAQNIMIAEEYIKKYVEFGAPSRYEISSIADFNNDGKMEIVLFGEYYEGSEASVYAVKGSKAVEVKELNAGCGV
jgi:hypothetical protein